MAAEVRAGLSARPLPWLPCKYFYDDRGSALFDEITRLPEYSFRNWFQPHYPYVFTKFRLVYSDR
jgi:Histidine-specific methyltransferase, SAM-dependent